ALMTLILVSFFFQADDGIRDRNVTGVQTCALPIFNADHIRLLPEAELAERLIPYLQAGGVLGDQVTEEQRALVAAATPLVQTRMNLLGEAPALMGFLFIADADLVVQDDALKKLGDDPVAVLDRTLRELEALPEGAFTAAALEEALRGAIIDEMGIKP